jgi:hypothetical protein
MISLYRIVPDLMPKKCVKLARRQKKLRVPLVETRAPERFFAEFMFLHTSTTSFTEPTPGGVHQL